MNSGIRRILRPQSYRILFLGAAFYLTAVLALAEKIPQIRAKLGPPVVEELMGGCSLTCSFPWDASGAADAAKITALNDSHASTAWTGGQIGDRLVFKFPADLPRELNGTPFYGIDIANGRVNPAASFQDFGRVKALTLYHNGKPLYLIQLADTRRWQNIEFPDIYLNVGDTLALEISALYPGKLHKTAALTEIVLQGAH